MDKMDARKLSVEGRSALRRMVIRLRQQSKMPVKELAAVAGVHFRTVEAWLSRARREGEGSLDGERKRGRRVGSCRKLAMVDEMWLRDQIVGQTPGQMQLPFALWTRRAIKALVLERFGVEMQDRLVGKYLKRWGCTPQRLVKVNTWLEERWPEVLARARAEGATALWGDETAVKEVRTGCEVLRRAARRRSSGAGSPGQAVHGFGHFRSGAGGLPDRRRRDQHGAFHRVSVVALTGCASEGFSGGRQSACASRQEGQ